MTPSAATTAPPRARSFARRWLPWAALALVLVVALALGSQRPSHPTIEARTLSIAAMVRCPVCEGQSAAQSSSPPSIAFRQRIHADLVAGKSQSTIIAGFVAAYGPGILEKPPASGIALWLWVLPIVAVVVAAGGLAVAFRRWRPRRGGTAPPGARGTGAAAAGDGGADVGA